MSTHDNAAVLSAMSKVYVVRVCPGRPMDERE